LDMLSSEQIKFIKEKQYTGGRKWLKTMTTWPIIC
jgi:hypothetical protein